MEIRISFSIIGLTLTRTLLESSWSYLRSDSSTRKQDNQTTAKKIFRRRLALWRDGSQPLTKTHSSESLLMVRLIFPNTGRSICVIMGKKHSSDKPGNGILTIS